MNATKFIVVLRNQGIILFPYIFNHQPRPLRFHDHKTPRSESSETIKQRAEKYNMALITGFIVVAHLGNSDRLKITFLFELKSELTNLNYTARPFCALSYRL